MTSSTIGKPPPVDPERSIIENALELTPLADIGPDVYTNTRPLWHPIGARGIYGGAVIAQCLSAAQRTVDSSLTVHSLHCYFVLAGDAEIPVVYHVERVRDGRSFATRTVQARQKGRPIFTVTMSFMRDGAGGEKAVEHGAVMPGGLEGPWEEDGESVKNDVGVQSWKLGILNENASDISTRKTRQWMRACGKISPEGGHQAHLNALAYMSDSFFIGTVARVHGLPRGKAAVMKANLEPREFSGAAKTSWSSLGAEQSRPEVGMMVSLDHAIYFHRPRGFRADEWFLTEAESPWAGDGRGVVMQKIWTREGQLVATCFQEGVIRLKGVKPLPAPPNGPEAKRESKL
ncbi:MAG: hypothetical protein M1839_004280 [Geoglossum umbratile]|nr:MAG: hypothetical protein M1839_004280 [Geoglossum umbratile]